MSTSRRDSDDSSEDSSDDNDTIFVIILPVTIVIFVSIFTYLFVGYMRLKKHLRNSGQVISALPFLILPEEHPEIRSPDGNLPPPSYDTIVETEYENVNNNTVNNNEGVLNYHHPSLTNFSLGTNSTQTGRERHRSRSRSSRPGNDRVSPAGVRGVGGLLVSPGEGQRSGPPSTEIMLERPPPIYSIESSTNVRASNDGRNGRRDRRKEAHHEHISMNDIAPPPYSPSPEVPVN